MKYKSHAPCGIFYHIARAIRHIRWGKIQPGMIRHDSYQAVTKHFSSGGY